MNKFKSYKYSIIEFFIIAIIGTLLHFTYELSGNNAIVGAFSAVNESVWEHLKLAVFPTLLVMLIQKYRKQIEKDNFYTVLLARTLIPMIFIPLVFYGYTSITNEPILFIDILTFYISIILSQFVGYKLSKNENVNENLEKLSKFLVIIIIIFFIVVTYYTPKLEIFRDSTKNSYGILK